ncbi:hypothetical protein JSY36_09170 [Bacillus sp. H-16]|nr:hypothetical protein [Alteribacter salitolerans]
MKESGETSLSYNTVTFHPTSTAISMNSTYHEEYNEEFHLLDFHIIDESGRSIQHASGSRNRQVKKGLYLNEYTFFYDPLKEKPEQLTITPFLFDTTEKTITHVRADWESKPVTLSQGEVGSVPVLDVVSEDHAT